MNKRILVMAPYPITKPQHGGQKRVAALVKFYEGIFEQTKFVAIFHKASYPDYSLEDIPLGGKELLDEIDKKPHAVDQIVGTAMDKDPHARSFSAKLLLEYKPDIIHIEQPYLYEGLSVLLKELGLTPRIIYGSANVEYEMKRAIYKELKVDDRDAKQLITETKELEERFSKEADLVLAVSESDAAAHRHMGARKVVVAPNGIDKIAASPTAKKYWREFMNKNNIDKAAVFIGSGHPPNYTSFLKMIGDDSTFLPAQYKIIIAGGVSEYFKTVFDYAHREKHKEFWNSIIPVGILEEDLLSGLLEEIETIMLPIQSGGGSNLKTAEAVVADAKVVATSYAFRGFERCRNLANVYIEDAPDKFKHKLLEVLDAPKKQRAADEKEIASSVLWENCLEPIAPAVMALRPRIIKPTIIRTKRLIRGSLRMVKRAITK